MNNGEAIHKLIQFRRILEKGVFPVGYRFDAEPFDMAISALEKQEAIKSCTPPSDDWEHYADRLHDIAYQSGYEQGERDADRWIPVTKALPEEDGDYLVTYESGYAEDYGFDPIGIAPFEVDCEGFGIWQERFDHVSLGSLGSDWVDIQVTAWRPLPEAFEAEEENEEDG